MTQIPTAADLALSSPAYWANLHQVKLQAGPFSFKGRMYQIEPMNSMAKRLVFMKGTQGGWTEIVVLRSLHAMIYCRYPLGVLYLFPTNDNVHEFSKSRFAPLIRANPFSIGKFAKTERGGKATDTTTQKQIGSAFLYLRGARLTQQVGFSADDKESVQLRSIPVDAFVADELDLMDDDIIEKARGRMAASTVQEEVYLSNPTASDRGVARLYNLSDQRQLFRTCSCGFKTCAEDSFPNCVKIDPKTNRGYIACGKCGKPVGIEKVEWVPKVKGDTEYVGYHWSQLSSNFVDPADILRAYNDPPKGDLTDVYRLRLGLPYESAEDRLTPIIVTKCCGQEAMRYGHTGPCAMGVDVGKTFHVVIGTATGRDTFEIVRVAQLTDWTEIHDLAKRFDVTSAVIDIRPYEDSARRFQVAEPYRIWLCEYTENAVLGDHFDDKMKTVKSYKTGVFDAVHALFAQRRIVIPRVCQEMDLFIKQVCGSVKIKEENKRTGTVVYRYRPTGTDGDHYRNAMAYFYLAASGHRVPEVGFRETRQTTAITEYEFT